MQVFIQTQFVEDVSHTVKAPKAMFRIFRLQYHNLTYAKFQQQLLSSICYTGKTISRNACGNMLLCLELCYDKYN